MLINKEKVNIVAEKTDSYEIEFVIDNKECGDI